MIPENQILILNLLRESELNSYQVGQKLGTSESVAAIYLVHLERHGYLESVMKEVTKNGKPFLFRFYSLSEKSRQILEKS